MIKTKKEKQKIGLNLVLLLSTAKSCLTPGMTLVCAGREERTTLKLISLLSFLFPLIVLILSTKLYCSLSNKNEAFDQKGKNRE